MRRFAAVLLAAFTLAATSITAQQRSGIDYVSPAVAALERDDTQNPGMLWVKAGEARLQSECAACHKPGSLNDAAARHPRWYDGLKRPLTLGERVRHCRRHVDPGPTSREADPLLELEAALVFAARGSSIVADPDPRLAPWRERGRQLYEQRVGQLDLSCAMCHQRHAGRKLAASTIPQAHPNGYPVYRLEWQALGSLARRIRGCMTGVRAAPYPDWSDELTALELHLMQRAAGMPIEGPGVRP